MHVLANGGYGGYGTFGFGIAERLVNEPGLEVFLAGKIGGTT